MLNVMATLPNTGSALCSMPQSLVDADYQSAVHKRCQDANHVEISWGAQTGQQTSAVNGPKFTILWGHVGDIAV